MKFVMHRYQIFFIDLSINLGGGDAGMSQKLLNRSQIGAPFDHMGGKTVAESMRADFFGDSGFQGVFLDHFPDPDPRE